jgi:NAD(P)-dependent dehydrogenase (short-subunit alcohol dehydrogenase family)
MRLAGKVAIVTGGGSGFGEGIVRKFVAEGAFVVLVDRDGLLSADPKGTASAREIAHSVCDRLGAGA